MGSNDNIEISTPIKISLKEIKKGNISQGFSFNLERKFLKMCLLLTNNYR